QAEGGHRRLDELHGVVNRQPSGDRAARRVDVKGDLFFGIFGLQEQELGGDQVGDVVVDFAAQKNNPVLEQPRVNVVGAFTAAGLLDNDWNQIAHNAIRRGMLTLTPLNVQH